MGKNDRAKLKLSLDQFANSIKPARICWVCRLPEREVIDERRRADDELRAATGNLHAGISVKNFAKWLKQERGYSPEEATETKFKAHFERNHHHQDSASTGKHNGRKARGE